MLSEQRRSQLDSIVQQMVNNKESDSNINFVVNDFKSKYENENVQPITPQKEKTLFEKAVGLSESTFGKASDFLFGSTGKAVGGLITSGIGEAMKFSESPETRARGEQLSKVGAEQVTPTNIAFSTLELYPGGGYVSKALKKIPGAEKVAEVLAKVPENLRAKAIKQYSEALGATKEEFKTLTKKVVPELLDRGVKTKNIESLSTLAKEKVSTAGKSIESFIEKIPQETKIKITPVFEALDKMKTKYIVEGKIVNPQATKAIDLVKKTVAQFGEDVSPKSIIQVRRILDENIAAGKGFTADRITKLSVKAEKAATDAIREVLSKDFPDLAKLNAEFTLWNNVKNITKATLKRTSTQGKGLSQVISSTVGGASGFASGDNMEERLKNAVVGAAIGKYVGVFKSPGYKMLSANTKNKLAKIIASGDKKRITYAMSKIFSALQNLK